MIPGINADYNIVDGPPGTKPTELEIVRALDIMAYVAIKKRHRGHPLNDESFESFQADVITGALKRMRRFSFGGSKSLKRYAYMACCFSLCDLQRKAMSSYGKSRVQFWGEAIQEFAGRNDQDVEESQESDHVAPPKKEGFFDHISAHDANKFLTGIAPALFAPQVKEFTALTSWSSDSLEEEDSESGERIPRALAELLPEMLSGEFGSTIVADLEDQCDLIYVKDKKVKRHRPRKRIHSA